MRLNSAVLLVIVLEGTAADRLAVADQQHEIADRRRKGFRRIAVEFCRGTLVAEIVAVAAVVFVDQFVDQRLGARVEGGGVEKRVAHVVRHLLSSVEEGFGQPHPIAGGGRDDRVVEIVVGAVERRAVAIADEEIAARLLLQHEGEVLACRARLEALPRSLPGRRRRARHSRAKSVSRAMIDQRRKAAPVIDLGRGAEALGLGAGKRRHALAGVCRAPPR